MLEFKTTKMDRFLENDFVCNVYYTISKKENSYVASIESTVSFVNQQEKTLIPYSDLTEEIVIDWVKNSIGADSLNEIDLFLTNNIVDQKTPKIISNVPWAK
jgi:hypothetical protein